MNNKPSADRILLLIGIFSLIISSCYSKPISADAAPSPSMSSLINEYYADKSDLKKVYIFKYSPEYFTRFTKLNQNWLKKLKNIHFNSLTKSGQVDYILLKRNIKNDQYNLEQNKKAYQKITYAIPFADKIRHIQQKRRRGQKLDAMKAASKFNDVMALINKAKKSVTKQPIPTKRLQQTITKIIKQLRHGLKNIYKFYNGYDPDFTWWMKKTYPETDSALANYAEWLGRQPLTHPDKAVDSSGIIGHPVGKKEIERELKFQMVPYSPEELIGIAKKQYAWCLIQMKKVSREMGYGNDWKKALEKVKHHYVKPGEQPQLINKLEEHAISFIDSLNLVTIPPLARESWRMVMLSPRQMEYASYFLGGPLIMVAYANEQQDYDTKKMIMRSGNYGFAHAEVFHEPKI